MEREGICPHIDTKKLLAHSSKQKENQKVQQGILLVQYGLLVEALIGKPLTNSYFLQCCVHSQDEVRSKAIRLVCISTSI